MVGEYGAWLEGVLGEPLALTSHEAASMARASAAAAALAARRAATTTAPVPSSPGSRFSLTVSGVPISPPFEKGVRGLDAQAAEEEPADADEEEDDDDDADDDEKDSVDDGDDNDDDGDDGDGGNDIDKADNMGGARSIDYDCDELMVENQSTENGVVCIENLSINVDEDNDPTGLSGAT